MASKDDIIAELRGIVAAQAKQIEDLNNRIAKIRANSVRYTFSTREKVTASQ